MIDGQNIPYQAVRNNWITYESSQKVATGQLVVWWTTIISKTIIRW